MDHGAGENQGEQVQRHNEDNSLSLERRNLSNQLVQTNEEPTSRHTDELSCKPAVAIRATEDANICVDLCDTGMWEEFSLKQNEMIITNIGRRMFPTLRVMCSNLDPNEKYCVVMELVNIDNNRYTFKDKKWRVSVNACNQIPPRLYVHPKSPATGEQWMKYIVSFLRVKLTNVCGNSEPGTLPIHSMRRYQPRVHFIRSADLTFLSNWSDCYKSTFAFPQTDFIAVTVYQNNEVASLKIKHNPFARGKVRSSGNVLPDIPRKQKSGSSQLDLKSEPEKKRQRNDVGQFPRAILSQPGRASYSMVNDQPHPAGPFPTRQLETCQGQTRSSDGHPQQPKGFSRSASSSHAILGYQPESSSDSLLQRGQTSRFPFDCDDSATAAQTDPCNYQNFYLTATKSSILNPPNYISCMVGSDRYINRCANLVRNVTFRDMVSNGYTFCGTSPPVHQTSKIANAHQMLYNSQHPSLHSETSSGSQSSMYCSTSEANGNIQKASNFHVLAKTYSNAFPESKVLPQPHITRHVKSHCEALRDPVMSSAIVPCQVSTNESMDSGYISNTPAGHEGDFTGPSSAQEYQPSTSSVGSTSMANVSYIQTESKPIVLSAESNPASLLFHGGRSEFPIRAANTPRAVGKYFIKTENSSCQRLVKQDGEKL